MKRDDIHRNLLNAIEKKIPDKSALVETLMETLYLEKGAVYRRLRGEVPFTFFEIVQVAEKLDISLNSLIYAESVRKNRFELAFIEYTAMNETEYKRWEDLLLYVGLAKNDPHSELADSSNILPICVYTGFDALAKYHLFKYQYLLHGTKDRITYSDLVVPERLHKIFRSYFEESKHFANTTFILDYMIFRYLVTDLRFFSDIRLMTSDDIQRIKNDLFAFLDYIEEIAANGCYKETENHVSIYISDVSIDSTYICTKINNIYVSVVRTFILNSVESFDESSYRKIQAWIQSQKKSATLITQSGTAYRAEFLEKQRKIISEL